MLEVKERNGLAVYLYYNRDVRKLSKFGEVTYHSRKMRYAIVYVDQEDVETVCQLLKGEKFVKRVVPSYYHEIDQDFVGNLQRMEKETVSL